MATKQTDKDYGKDQNTTAQSSANSSANQQGKSEGSGVAMSGDRQRPIESGREAGRGGNRGGSIARQRGNAPVRGGMSSPFTAMQRMAEDMDRLFEQFGFGRTGLGMSPRFGSLLDDDLWSGRDQMLNTVWTPQVETFRRGDNLVIRADIPGVKKDDVHVDIDNDVLTISGERKEEHEDNSDGYYRSERSYGQFYRAIPLPEGVNADQCDASFKDGVLEVTLRAPKQDQREARRIQIK
jgi:HSP20 family protein